MDTCELLCSGQFVGINNKNARGILEHRMKQKEERNNVMKKANETDWEKRRYEIAKELFLHWVKTSLNSVEDDAENAVKWADLFISKLKKEG